MHQGFDESERPASSRAGSKESKVLMNTAEFIDTGISGIYFTSLPYCTMNWFSDWVCS